MAVDPGEKPDLQDIAGPAATPSEVPDFLTVQEQKRAKKAAGKLTPTQLVVAAKDQHLDDACTKRDHLEKENKRIQSNLDRLRGDLGTTSVDHQNMKVTLRFSLVWNGVSTIVLTLGSALISAASIWPQWTVSLFASGTAVLVCGVLTYVVTLVLSLYSTSTEQVGNQVPAVPSDHFDDHDRG